MHYKNFKISQVTTYKSSFNAELYESERTMNGLYPVFSPIRSDSKFVQNYHTVVIIPTLPTLI